MEISDGTDGSDQIDISATFDAQGRQTSYTDALGNLTTYSFSSGSSGTTETIAFKASGASTPTTIETLVSNLDGSAYSDSGTSVATPSTEDEGVVTSSLTIDGVTVPAGSTWTQTLTNSSNDWTKTYYNLLGEQIAAQQTSFVGRAADPSNSTSTYDGNGRVIIEVGVDGSITHYDYDPVTGESAATWVDNDGNGQFDSLTDSRQRSHQPTPLTGSDGVYSGVRRFLDATSGQQPTFGGSRNGGLDTEQIVNGQAHHEPHCHRRWRHRPRFRDHHQPRWHDHRR